MQMQMCEFSHGIFDSRRPGAPASQPIGG
jgi:hypothetical protein